MKSGTALYPFLALGTDYVVCRREKPPADAAGLPTSEILLSGNFKRIDVADLVNFLNMSRLTGVLLLIDGEKERSLHFDGGEVIFATSKDKDDRIGEVLVRLGKLNQRQLEEISIKFPGNMKIGRFLVQQELISPQVLWEGIRQQVREIFFGALEMDRGVFFLLDAEAKAGAELNLSLATPNLLLEGVQRKDEMAYFRKRIPNDDVVLVKKHPLPTKELTANERRLLHTVDGKLALSEVARRSQLERFVVLKTLFHLLQAGFLDICEQAVPVVVKPENAPVETVGAGDQDRRLRDIIGVFNEIFVEILQALRQRMPAAGALKALNAFFRNVESNLGVLFGGLKLHKDGKLDGEALIRNLAGLEPSERGTVLTDGLKEFFFFCVFEATSRLDSPEEDALLERIQKLQKNLRA